MKIKIYQINSDRDKDMLRFSNFAETKEILGSKIKENIYDNVFDADIDEEDLESIYRRFNSECHPLFRGHSLSVSDVVIKENEAYFCDSVGFKKIDFDETIAQIPENTYKIVYVEPGKPAYETEIGADYDSLSRAVGGLIEVIYDTDDDTVYVGNDEAKLIGMDGNRHMKGGGVIAGPFVVIGDNGEDFRSLTDEETAKYIEKFSQPEDISQQEVEADMGFTFIGFE